MIWVQSGINILALGLHSTRYEVHMLPRIYLGTYLGTSVAGMYPGKLVTGMYRGPGHITVSVHHLAVPGIYRVQYRGTPRSDTYGNYDHGLACNRMSMWAAWAVGAF